MGEPSWPPLDVDAVGAEPMATCARWVEDARAAGQVEPEAMTLATVDEHGRLTARVVLARRIDAEGVVFYTNEQSAKGRAIAARPHVALTFVWPALRRQIRIEGTVARTSAAVSDAYFAARPRDRQLAAWASDQSSVVASRQALDEAYAAMEARFAGGDVPRPPHWGGYCVTPSLVELWQGRPTRLHDRLCYTRSAGVWAVSRLAP